MTSVLDRATIVRSPCEHRTQATVFGLDVHADTSLSFLQGARATPTGNALELSVAPADAAPNWPSCARLVCDQREPDGSVSFRIEAHPQRGFLIWGPAYGSHLVSSDGRRLRCAPEGRRAGDWQRLLIGQVLPFAALLRGLEILHASAVAIEGGAIAFLGRAGSGKTSAALELTRRGAAFVADDVLALARAGEVLLAQPGTPVAGVDHAEARRLAQVGATRPLETLAVNAHERLVRMPGAAAPAPLTTLFFLDRRRDGPRDPRFAAVDDPRLLLGATFNSVLTQRARLRELLEVCALAARRRVERVMIGPCVDAAALATALERRIGGRT